MIKLTKKLMLLILTSLTLFTSLSGYLAPINAATYQPENLYDIPGTGATVKQGSYTAYWYGGLGKISVEGNIAFYILI